MDETRPEEDAIASLVADHKRVAKLFAQFDALKDDGNDDRKVEIVAQICRELTVHTALEEELFYPAARRAIEDDDLMDESLVEHAGAKDLIAQLQSADADDDLYDAKVTVLGEQIDHHVTEEEGSMFPQARAAGLDVRSLGEQMRHRRSELLAAPMPMPVTVVPAPDAPVPTDAPVHGDTQGPTDAPPRSIASPRGDTAPRGKVTSRGKAAPRGNAAPGGKAAPQGKAASQGKAAPGGKAAPQGKAASQGKAAPGGKAASRGKSASQGKAALLGRAAPRSKARKTTKTTARQSAKAPGSKKAPSSKKAQGSKKTPRGRPRG